MGNGSISGFPDGVALSGFGSIVEGLRVFGGCPCNIGIAATGIVKGNTVVGIARNPGLAGIGISATGTVTGNYVIDYCGEIGGTGYSIGAGSTVIGNTAAGCPPSYPFSVTGFAVSCPSNVTDNTAVNNRVNLKLNGNGCNDTNNWHLERVTA